MVEETRFEFDYFGDTQARLSFKSDPENPAFFFNSETELGLRKMVVEFLEQYWRLNPREKELQHD